MTTRHNQLYLTLPSNSSMNYYPNNTVANYITHLPSVVRLSGGEWEVALVEAHYPCSFITVGGDARILLYTKGDADKPALIVAKVEPGNYKDIDELVNAINAIPKLKSNQCEFEHDRQTGKVELISIDQTVVQLELSSTLALQMGYDVHSVDLIKQRKAIRPPNLLAGIPSYMYVYCDLVEPQLVGDTVAPLLKIVNIDAKNYTYGAHNIVHFTDPHYVPLMKSSFESVEIDLRDSAGHHLPFHFGTTCMKLHLRREQQ